MNSFHSKTKINSNPGDRNTTLIRLVGASPGLLIFLTQKNSSGHMFQENFIYTGAAIVATLLILLGLQWRKDSNLNDNDFPINYSQQNRYAD